MARMGAGSLKRTRAQRGRSRIELLLSGAQREMGLPGLIGRSRTLASATQASIHASATW